MGKIQVASVESPPEYTCYRAIGTLTIDGHLRETAWQGAPRTRRFVHITSGERVPLNTQAMMLWDDTHFYVGYIIEETDVFGTEARHHTPVYHNDHDVELFIDPDSDGKNYYEFQINPLNTINEVFWDKPPDEGGKGIFGWDLIGIRHAVQVQGTLNCPEIKDEGWTVELALPWKSLKKTCPAGSVPPKPGDTWRVNFTRVEKTRKRPEVVKATRQFTSEQEAFAHNGCRPEAEVAESTDWVWAVAPYYSAHVPPTWGYVHFSGREVGAE